MLDSTSVDDVDVGLYLDDSQLSRQSEILDTLTDRVVAAVALPVDVRILNAAPGSFLFHVVLMLFTKREFSRLIDLNDFSVWLVSETRWFTCMGKLMMSESMTLFRINLPTSVLFAQP